MRNTVPYRYYRHPSEPRLKVYKPNQCIQAELMKKILHYCDCYPGYIGWKFKEILFKIFVFELTNPNYIVCLFVCLPYKQRFLRDFFLENALFVAYRGIFLKHTFSRKNALLKNPIRFFAKLFHLFWKNFHFVFQTKICYLKM